MKRILTILLVLVGLTGFAQHHTMYTLAGQEYGLLTNLVSCWEMDDASGSTVTDEESTHNGTAYNSTFNQTGLINKAIDLNGTSSYFNMTDFAPKPLSISMWVNPDNIDVYLVHYFHRIYLKIMWDSKIEFKIYDGSSFGTAAISTTTITTGTWYHIVVTWDDSSLDTQVYINGVLEHTGASNSGNYGYNAVVHYFGIGKRTDSPAGYMEGLIDQTAVWNTVLTQEQISTLYNNGNGLPYRNW